MIPSSGAVRGVVAPDRLKCRLGVHRAPRRLQRWDCLVTVGKSVSSDWRMNRSVRPRRVLRTFNLAPAEHAAVQGEDGVAPATILGVLGFSKCGPTTFLRPPSTTLEPTRRMGPEPLRRPRGPCGRHVRHAAWHQSQIFKAGVIKIVQGGRLLGRFPKVTQVCHTEDMTSCAAQRHRTPPVGGDAYSDPS